MNDQHERKCHDCGNVAIHEDRITPWVLCKKCGSQDTRPTKPPPPTREQQLESTVAELVGLLRMGQELSEASRDIEAYRHCGQGKMQRAESEVKRILGLYDEAIAKHGGA